MRPLLLPRSCLRRWWFQRPSNFREFTALEQSPKIFPVVPFFCSNSKFLCQEKINRLKKLIKNYSLVDPEFTFLENKKPRLM